MHCRSAQQQRECYLLLFQCVNRRVVCSMLCNVAHASSCAAVPLAPRSVSTLFKWRWLPKPQACQSTTPAALCWRRRAGTSRAVCLMSCGRAAMRARGLRSLEHRCARAHSEAVSWSSVWKHSKKQDVHFGINVVRDPPDPVSPRCNPIECTGGRARVECDAWAGDMRARHHRYRNASSDGVGGCLEDTRLTL